MIVGGDAIEVLSPIRFLLYMIFPSAAVFLITILWVERCWMRNRLLTDEKLLKTEESSSKEGMSNALVPLEVRPRPRRKDANRRNSLLSPYKKDSTAIDATRELDFNRKKSNRGLVSKVVRVIVTPFPYAMLLLMAIMIAMIFVDVMSISGLICLTAVIMVIILVLGNHWCVALSSNNAICLLILVLTLCLCIIWCR